MSKTDTPDSAPEGIDELVEEDKYRRVLEEWAEGDDPYLAAVGKAALDSGGDR